VQGQHSSRRKDRFYVVTDVPPPDGERAEVARRLPDHGARQSSELAECL
jgi:hypothetical protein